MKRKKHNSGIALVMVLGILSVMVIMAVAFAISMRTERVAAGNYADSVRARHLVQVGLARALNDLAVKLGTNGLGSVGGLVYPPWDVTNSYTTAYTNTSTNKLYLLTGKATNFVPRALWAAATNADCRAAANHWLPLDSIIYTNGSVAESNRMGRVKYLILNCSGLLDANFAGGEARDVGTNPLEIAISYMPEMKSYNVFTNNRADNYRYETQEELAELNTNAFYGAPSNFTVYSHAYPGWWDTNSTITRASVDVGLTLTKLKLHHEQITNAFYLAGFTSNEPSILYSNLLDYVDKDYVPGNYYSCVEPVPMINEMVFKSVQSYDGITYYYTNTVTYELWYPFIKGGGSYYFTTSNDFASSTVPTVSVCGNEVVSFSPNSFWCVTVTNWGQSIVNPGAFNVTIRSAYVYTEILSSFFTVDALLAPVTFNSSLIPNGNVLHFECLDPRFNWNPTNNAEWVQSPLPSSITLGAINAWTRDFWSTENCDSNSAMYIANHQLELVGEMGYLCYAPWKTINLYDTNSHRVLDFFAVGSNATDTATNIFVTDTILRGRVNPNSKETDALAAVFADMPVNNGANKLSWSQAIDIANYLQANVQTYGYYRNLSDIGKYFTAFPSTITNKLQKNEFISNAAGLLNVRQNLFTIIIEAQVASGGNIPRNPVRQRAVVIVWRDPYTGEMFNRNIIWLRD